MNIFKNGSWDRILNPKFKISSIAKLPILSDSILMAPACKIVFNLNAQTKDFENLTGKSAASASS